MWQRNSFLQKTFEFKNFDDCWNFMCLVAKKAKEIDHHPEWTNVYNKVTIKWTTHSENKITELDEKMAEYCDSIY